ncbi:hypothetical protein DID88_006575 [Monilinia fructigena]|uniref:Uncharacterized protein n=1 Tax=Monilinia fructigena TaxID=38457 RepID=A0A395IGY1_9HELO|nr:hypothetical protein DID88_006575 [Monilinia fructigena]
MFCLCSFFAVALAGRASAFTPSGFEPASSENLTVAYGSKLAINGIQMLRADTASAPILGTATKMTGTYTVMMVDPDIPSSKAGNSTSQFLHWMQSGLTSANTTTTIDGQKIYDLTSSSTLTSDATSKSNSTSITNSNTTSSTPGLAQSTGGAAGIGSGKGGILSLLIAMAAAIALL